MANESLYLSYSLILGFSNFVIGEVTKATNLASLSLEKFPDHSLSNALTGLLFGYNVVYKFNPKISDKSYDLGHIDNAISLEPKNLNKSRLYWFKYQIFSDLRKNSEALEAIDQAIDLQPMLFPLYLSKIRVLLELNQYKEIILVLDHLLFKFPDKRKNILLKKASTLKKMRKGNDGFQIIEDLIQDFPHDNDLLLHQAYWQQFFNQKADSLDTMHILTERDPTNGIYFETYGEILMSFEEYSQALIQFKQSLKYQLNNSDIFQIHIKLGICYK
jgi:tetratricopeptide (TPR) repeat protein